MVFSIVGAVVFFIVSAVLTWFALDERLPDPLRIKLMLGAVTCTLVSTGFLAITKYI